MSTDAPLPPFVAYRRNVAAVLQWEDLRGSRSIWQLIRDEVSRLDGVALVGCATHWNALLQTVGGDTEIRAQLPIVGYLGTQDQLRELHQAAERKRAREGWSATPVPPLITRQTLLILMRLAFEHARWDGSGAPPARPQVLELLLRINDHLDGLPDLSPRARRRRRPSTLADRYRAFALMFSLHDLSHEKPAEAGVTRTLRMLREIHPELAAREDLRGTAIDAPALFRESTGLDLETYLSLLFAAVAVSTPPGRPGSPHPGRPNPEDTGIFNIAPRNLIGDSATSEADAQRFLDNLALTPEQFRAVLGDGTQLPEQTNFTVFRRYPLVFFPGGRHRVLDKAFLFDKLSTGTYWALRALVEGKAPAGTTLDAVKRFNGWWGRLFEEYLHRLFTNSRAAGYYLQEPKLDGSTRESGDCDGLLDYGEQVVLLEYKMSSLAARPRHSTSPLALAAEILRKFAARRGTGTGRRRSPRGASQLSQTVREFLSGRKLGRVEPSRVKALFPVLVCADSGMGAAMVNCLLRARFERDLSGAGAPLVQPFSVLTVENVETMLAHEDRVPFPMMLRAWHEGDPEMTTYPWLIIHGRFFSEGVPTNPWVRQASDAWREEMLNRLWPNRKRPADAQS